MGCHIRAIVKTRSEQTGWNGEQIVRLDLAAKKPGETPNTHIYVTPDHPLAQATVGSCITIDMKKA